MPARRRPTDTVQINLRIKEQERRQLAAAAEASGVSLNAEMAHRLAQSFEQGQLLDTARLHESAETALLPVIDNFHALRIQQSLLEKIKKLIERNQRLLATRVITGAEGDGIKRDIADIETAINAVEFEWLRRLRKMGGAE